MQQTLLDFELQDGTVGTVRILAADKVGMEKTVRLNHWPLEDGPRAATLILFYALRRNDLIVSENYDDFIAAELADYASHDDSDDSDDTDGADVDPKAR